MNFDSLVKLAKREITKRGQIDGTDLLELIAKARSNVSADQLIAVLFETQIESNIRVIEYAKNNYVHDLYYVEVSSGAANGK